MTLTIINNFRCLCEIDKQLYINTIAEALLPIFEFYNDKKIIFYYKKSMNVLWLYCSENKKECISNFLDIKNFFDDEYDEYCYLSYEDEIFKKYLAYEAVRILQRCFDQNKELAGKLIIKNFMDLNVKIEEYDYNVNRKMIKSDNIEDLLNKISDLGQKEICETMLDEIFKNCNKKYDIRRKKEILKQVAYKYQNVLNQIFKI